MNKPLKFAAIVAIAAMMTSCAGYRETLEVYKPVNTSVLHIGMTRDEAQQALQKKPYGVVAARNDSESKTTIEVVQYTQGTIAATASDVVDNYWLYFLNGRLDRWERADPRRTPII